MKYKGEIILAVLFLYVVALGVVTYDELSSPPHLFPPPLERQVIDAVKKFSSTASGEAQKAQAEVLNIEDFVTVPVLVYYLGGSDLQTRKITADTLQQIGDRLQSQGGTPPPVPQFKPDGSSEERSAGQQRWRKWMAENQDRL
jgi:hypothetical protein